MKVGIVDADLIARKRHRFPNLACMKLSAFEKSVGNGAELVIDYANIQQYDKVYISKVFTDTPVPQEVLSLPNVIIGGTGFFYDKAPPLPHDVEHIMPDYHLYDPFVHQLVIQGAKHTKPVQRYQVKLICPTNGASCNECIPGAPCAIRKRG